MSELHFQCQYTVEDTMVVSIGEFVCIEIHQNGKAMSVCLDEKQVYTLMKYLNTYSYE